MGKTVWINEKSIQFLDSIPGTDINEKLHNLANPKESLSTILWSEFTPKIKKLIEEEIEEAKRGGY